jgi:hypothetical protein
MSDERPPLERALELVVYAPLGMAAFARDSAPTFLRLFVARGQTEVAQRRKRLADQAGQWRSIGQLAVRFGAPHVRRRAEERLADARRVAGQVAGQAGQMAGQVAGAGFASVADLAAGLVGGRAPQRPARQRPPEPRGGSPERTGASRGDAAGAVEIDLRTGPVVAAGGPADAAAVPPVAELPIPDYDELSATQVIERLEGLSAEELAAVGAYERAHRGRNTILGKIAQLAG